MRRTLLAGLALLLGGLWASAVDVDLAYVDDITALTSECFIQVMRLEGVLVEDEDEEPFEALVGRLKLAEGEHVVRITAEDEGPILLVDLDASGELTRVEWDRILVDGSFLADVSLTLTYEDDVRAPYRVFLVWSPFLPVAMTFCRNTYREGEAALGERTLRVGIVDADTDGRYDLLEAGVLLIDTDGDGELLATGDSHELYFLDEPFNVDGTTYEVVSVAPDGSGAQIALSQEQVEPKPPLLAGFPAPAFTGSNQAGEELSVEAFAGDVVVLDFWAGWCGPCIAELPTLREILSTYGDRGLAVVGVNMDRTSAEFEEALAEHAIDWPQVFDGADGPVGDLYRIEGIPMTYLIDSDGIIVDRGLRGQRLIDAVVALLEDEEGGAP